IRPRELSGQERHDLQHIHQLAAPTELAVPSALKGFLINVELDAAVEIVFVLRNPLDHPERSLGKGTDNGCPGDSLPRRVHVANELEIRPIAAPAAGWQPHLFGLSLQAERVDETQLIGFSSQGPREVFGFAVEEL